SPEMPAARGLGWMLDDNRPVLTIAEPPAGATDKVDRVLIGMHDYYTGVDPASLAVTADFEIDGAPPGKNLADKFQKIDNGVWQLRLASPITRLDAGKLKVSVKDREGNTTEIERTFRVQ
ncbi:MAG: hypothetical protein KDA41_16535, partial [Planctomycetales bacterium]|nr:hypothetical protein [Planctomycetales bacterium]